MAVVLGLRDWPWRMALLLTSRSHRGATLQQGSSSTLPERIRPRRSLATGQSLSGSRRGADAGTQSASPGASARVSLFRAASRSLRARTSTCSPSGGAATRSSGIGPEVAVADPVRRARGAGEGGALTAALPLHPRGAPIGIFARPPPWVSTTRGRRARARCDPTWCWWTRYTQWPAFCRGPRRRPAVHEQTSFGRFLQFSPRGSS